MREINETCRPLGLCFVYEMAVSLLRSITVKAEMGYLYKERIGPRCVALSRYVNYVRNIRHSKTYNAGPYLWVNTFLEE